MRGVFLKYKSSFKTLCFTLAFILALSAAAGAAPRYLFLFIGDGMGANQRTLTEYYAACAGGAPRQPECAPLRMNRFPVQGMMRIHALDKYITDSAASATAMATGQRTVDSAVAVMSDRKTPLTTIAELARREGLAVGMITSTPINHATPACFYAHHRSRDGYSIAKQIPQSGFEFFAGGAPSRPRGKNKDLLPVLDIVRKAGYAVAEGFDAAARVATDKKLLLIASDPAGADGFPYAVDDGENRLRRAVELGIEQLSKNEKGFFMLVEGGKIDWAAHINDTRTVIGEVLNFDEALQPAIEFVQQHPAEATLVVTSDHDTGGLALGWYGAKYASDFAVLAGQKRSAGAIYKELQPLRAQRAPFHEARLAARSFFGLADLSAREEADLAESWRQALKPWDERRDDPEYRLKYGSFDPFVTECMRILAHRAGVAWTNWAHTAAAVPVSAMGAGAPAFGGVYANADLFGKMKKLLFFSK